MSSLLALDTSELSTNWGHCKLKSTNQRKSNQILVFVERGGEGKTGVPGEKPLGAEQRTNKLNPHMTTGPFTKKAPLFEVASLGWKTHC